MKVNIVGRGSIAGIGLLPVYNKELTDSEIRRLLNFQNIRVYEVGGGLITKSSFLRKTPAKPVRITTPVKPAVINADEEVAAPVTSFDELIESTETTTSEECVDGFSDEIAAVLAGEVVAEKTELGDLFDETADAQNEESDDDSTEEASDEPVEETKDSAEETQSNHNNQRHNRKRRHR